MSGNSSLDELIGTFDDEPGYLDFARFGPIGGTVLAEAQAMMSLLARSRYGTLATLDDQDLRVRTAVASLTGFEPSAVVFQPDPRQALMQVLSGLTGRIALNPADFAETLFAHPAQPGSVGSAMPQWLETDHGGVTPGNLREQLTDDTSAVVLSAVDFRTGYFADIEGIHQVIGDRLLIVDAAQGFGIVDAPWQLADVVLSGGHKWVRAGWGTGFMAFSDRATDRMPLWVAGALAVSTPDPLAQARLAVALEEIAAVGVPVLNARLAQNTAAVIELADEFALEVVSPRDDAQRAGIVVVSPPADRLTTLTAAFHNHGVTVTTRQGSVRLSPHITTDDESFAMLRASLVAYAG